MFKLFTKRALIALTLVVFVGAGFRLCAVKPEGDWQGDCFLLDENGNKTYCNTPNVCGPRVHVTCKQLGQTWVVQVPSCEGDKPTAYFSEFGDLYCY